MRDNGLIVVVCLLIVAQGKGRLRVALGAVGPIVGLALYNRSTFGAPWASGYSYWLGPFREYSLSYVFKHPWPTVNVSLYQSSLSLFHLATQSRTGPIGPLPNLVFYPLILLGFSVVYGVPGLTLIGLVTAIRSWKRPQARFTVLVACGSALFYMPQLRPRPSLPRRSVRSLDGLGSRWARWDHSSCLEPNGKALWNPDPSALQSDNPIYMNR